MASQIIAEILSAEQSVAAIVSQAQAEAEKRIDAAERQARQCLEDGAAEAAAAVQAIARETQEEIVRINGEAEKSAGEKARGLQQAALQKLDAAQALVISMIIPE